jgi:hypothetical protein
VSKPKLNSLTVPRSPGSGPAADPAEEYAKWLARIPDATRRGLADLLSKHPVKNYDELVDFSILILVELLAGNITPVIAHEARNWVEMIFTIIATKNSAMGTPESAHTNIVAALIAVQQTMPIITANYTNISLDQRTQEPLRVINSEG